MSTTTTTTKNTTIVVGYDRKAPARDAVRAAAERAGPGGRVVVVHAVGVAPADLLDTAGYEDALRAHDVLRADLRDEVLALTPAWVDVDVEIMREQPADALASVARSHDADEIVVGSRRLRPLRGALTSISQRVVRRADRPVVVVPAT